MGERRARKAGFRFVTLLARAGHNLGTEWAQVGFSPPEAGGLRTFKGCW